jgi:drug/metabolite transporter (DMT)-like permease
LAGHLFLHEQVSVSRWTGVALIVAGAALTSLTDPATEETAP